MSKKIIISTVAIVVVIVAIILGVNFLGKDTPYDYDLSEYVEVGDYKGLEYSIEEVSVTDEEVDEEIDTRLQNAATTETVTEGTVEDGDTINVAYVGTIDGEEFEGGTTDSSDITIGTTQMIDGFTDGLIGAEVGETVTLDLKFPDDYHNDEVAGKDVTFKVTVNSKSIKNVPELNEDFVKKNSDVDTVEEYKAAVREELLANKESQAELTSKEALWDKVLEKCEVKKYPDKEYEAAKQAADDIETQYKTQAESYGMEWEEFLSGYLMMTEDEFNEAKQQYADDTVLQEMVMYYIAREEGLEVTDKEYKEYLDNQLEMSGYTEDSFKQSYNMTIEEYAESYQWKKGLLLDKVLDKVMEYGTEVEAADSEE